MERKEKKRKAAAVKAAPASMVATEKKNCLVGRHDAQHNDIRHNDTRCFCWVGVMLSVVALTNKTIISKKISTKTIICGDLRLML